MSERGSLEKVSDDLKYLNHQIEGVRWMARRTSFILADDMGLGKTLQALTVAAVDFEKGWANRVIVVCPSTLKGNWYEEIKTHTSFTSMVLSGDRTKRSQTIEKFQYLDTDILITNYEQIRGHLEELSAANFDIAIFDEAHMMKNPKAKRTQACLRLRASRSFLLTGSPVLNQVDELWSMLHRCNPIEFPDYYRFLNRYAVFGGYQGRAIIGIKNREELNATLSRYMIRRLKSEVLDLPPKQNIQVFVDMTPEQKAMYQQARDEMRVEVSSGGDDIDINNTLTKMLRLKQIAGTTASLDPDTDHSQKLDRATEMVEEISKSNDKVVVFTQFRTVLASFQKRIEKKLPNVPTYVIHGDTKKEDRVPLVQAWGNQEGAAVIICMLQVGGVGLNMTAANKAIFLDKLWTPKMNEQAEDRIHRIGADKEQPAQIFEMICRGTIESRIERILKQKRHIFKSLVEESNWKKRLVEEVLSEDEDDEEEL